MDIPAPRPDVRRVLSRLKDFQRNTVDYVFRRMFEDTDCATRFLVADEVGLGKTMVAGGVIARAVDRLWDEVPRIDVVYVCSNASIARQNVNRLRRLLGGHAAVLPSRITLLPQKVKDLAGRKLNLVSFTPGTSFDLRSSLGTMDERGLLHRMLPESWKANDQGTLSVLQGGAGRESFKRYSDYYSTYPIDQGLLRGFQEALAKPDAQPLRDRFVALADALGGRFKNLSNEESRERSAVVGELRGKLAASCLEALEPDLIVLDEFQRFKHLLGAEDECGQLARDLFNYRDPRTGQSVRILLLSATPYKMYTVNEEAGGEDHFEDFIATVRFLQNQTAATDAFRHNLTAYRRALFQFSPDSLRALTNRKSEIQDALRAVMVRTERLSVSGDRNGMLMEIPAAHLRLEASDLEAFVAVQGVGRALGHADTMEYWKSAPYLLNFMEEYQIKRDFKDAVDRSTPPEVYERLASCAHALLSWDDVQAYRRIDPGNARLRHLVQDIDEDGLWRLFWLPPSLPYYRLGGHFAAARPNRVTKRLLFSSWQVVPKVVSALLSYDVERRLQGTDENGRAGANTAEERRKQKGLLKFGRDAQRASGMPVLALLYPSSTLAREVDPLQISASLMAAGDSAAVPELPYVLARAETLIEQLLATLPPSENRGGEDDRWYWAAPILLDLERDRDRTLQWFGQHDLKVRWRQGVSVEAYSGARADDEREDEDASEGWSLHVDEAHALRNGQLQLGRQPSDLARVLALLAVGGPGTIALRALARVAVRPTDGASVELRNAAGRIAEGFRTLFNRPDVMALVGSPGLNDKPYWQRVLDYAISGCLQAVMDEYAHVALELTGARGTPEGLGDLVNDVLVALTLRTATVGVDVLRLDSEKRQVRLESERRGFRAHFALRFGERKGEETAGGTRQDAVRKAFNSPFWPFVLCSTSVGQEGLDFHPYCHAIVHWNLPANPVDLEQREGRIHRYKGHAVRKNLAFGNGHQILTASTDGGDLWDGLFAHGQRQRSDDDTDLVPYWVYPAENGAHIERHIPALPLSREVERARTLRAALVVYRMAFGQNRQEDLLAYLLDRIPSDRVEELAAHLRMELAPPPTGLDWSATSDSFPELEVPALEIVEEDVDPLSPNWNPNLDDLRALLDSVHSLITAPGPTSDLDDLRGLLDAAAVLFSNRPGLDAVHLRLLLDQFVALCSLSGVVASTAESETV